MSKMHVEWDEAFQEEIKVLKARRKKKGDATDGIEKNLVGLAISGGGIRSATFALGVLEALRNAKILPKVDYLSTVSGGGYIGAWLTANCQRSANQGQESWLKSPRWAESIQYLRNYSNYLSPTLGFLSADTWSVGAIWLRNTLLVQLTVIFALAVVLLAPRLLYEAFTWWPQSGNLRWTTIVLYILGAVGIGGNHLRLGRMTDVKFLRGTSWRKGLVGAAVFLGVALFDGIALHFEPFTNTGTRIVPAGWIALMLIAGGFCLQPVMVRLLNRVWWAKGPAPQRINYSQPWVQGLVVIPMMIVGFLVGAILWQVSLDANGELGKIGTFGEFFARAWNLWPFPLAVVFFSLWLFSICSIRDFEDPKCWAIALIAPFPSMVTLHALLCGIMVALHSWAAMGEQGPWLAYTWAPPMVLCAFSLTAVILIGMMGRQSLEGVREWWSRFGAWLGIYGFAWLVIGLSVTYGPLLSFYLVQKLEYGIPISGAWIGTTLAGLLAGNSANTSDRAEKPEKSTLSKVLEVLAKIAPAVFLAGLLVAVSTLLHLLIVSNSHMVWHNVAELVQRHWTFMDGQPQVTLGIGAVCLAVFLLLAWRVDINEFSLNAFYRNRLIRCYLGATRTPDERKPQRFTGFDDKDDLTLASLQTLKSGEAASAPFHIINCALNLGGTKDLSLHTRHSAVFTLTPLRCGTDYVRHDEGVPRQIGYFPTEKYGGKDGQPTLGQAISVSGAAASPNMGYHTSPLVAFLLTLFDVRLGWWFPNPNPVQRRKNAKESASPAFSLRYLIMELFGGAKDKSAYLAISDGGHFENLATYELIRRKCRIVIISDGECDPNLQFEGLGRLIRLCEVDFHCKISIDVSAIRKGDGAWSSRRCAVGRIVYKDGSPGTLVYLKASMTGEEATSILQYKATHPDFPHESTGNQFYTEDQFESYRGLGLAVAETAFAPVADETDLESAARDMEDIWSPVLQNTATFAQHSTRLMEVWSKLSRTPSLEFLDEQLNEWPEEATSEFRPAFYFCCELIQLMENVFLDLRLEETWEHSDNAGWRATFLRWALSPSIQQTWTLTSTTFGLRFQHFCRHRLGLPMTKSVAARGGST